MKIIYKLPLAVADWQHVNLPEESQFLSLQVQNGVPCLWVMRDTDSEEPYHPLLRHRRRIS